MSTPERKAKAIRVTQMQRCRVFISKGEFDRAEALAQKHGFTTAEARARAWDGGASLPQPPAPPAAPVPPPEPPAPVELVNGWPKACAAEIIRYCRNQRQLVIVLEDGREATLWRSGRHYRLGTRIWATLDEAGGDPRYVVDHVL